MYSVNLFCSSSTNSLNSTTLSHQSNNNEEITVEINGANTTPTINTNEEILEIVSGLITYFRLIIIIAPCAFQSAFIFRITVFQTISWFWKKMTLKIPHLFLRHGLKGEIEQNLKTCLWKGTILYKKILTKMIFYSKLNPQQN